jgi:hypothetical protein
MSAPWQWWVGGVLAGGAFVWLLLRNLRALRDSREMLDGRPPTTLSRAAWVMSFFSAWTGPLVGIFALLSLILGFVARRGSPNPRTRLASKMAVENGLVLALSASALVGLLFWGAS